MADSLQKIDRLIKGQGQIIEIATRADQNADTAAREVANLTVATQRQFDELRPNQEQFLVTQKELRINQEWFSVTQEKLRANQERFLVSQEELRTNQEELKAGQDRLLANYEELKTNQEKLSVGQDLILQILREKLP